MNQKLIRSLFTMQIWKTLKDVFAPVQALHEPLSPKLPKIRILFAITTQSQISMLVHSIKYWPLQT